MSERRFFDAVVLLAGASDPQLPELQTWVDLLASRFERDETPTLISTGCCHHSLDIFPGRTEAQITRDLLIERGVPASNILCEESSGDLMGRIVHTYKEILAPCSWYHIELILPGATDQERDWLERAFGSDFELSIADEPLPETKTAMSDTAAFGAVLKTLGDVLSPTALQDWMIEPKARGRPLGSPNGHGQPKP